MEKGNEARGGRWRCRPFIKGTTSLDPQGAASLPRRETSLVFPYCLLARRDHLDVVGCFIPVLRRYRGDEAWRVRIMREWLGERTVKYKERFGKSMWFVVD